MYGSIPLLMLYDDRAWHSKDANGGVSISDTRKSTRYPGPHIIIPARFFSVARDDTCHDLYGSFTILKLYVNRAWHSKDANAGGHLLRCVYSYCLKTCGRQDIMFGF